MAGRMIFRGRSDNASLQRVVAACCLMISGHGPVHAEDYPDPTRPPTSIFAPVAGAVREATESQSSGLRTVIISATRRAAIIDGQTVELGGQHGDARLIEVNEGGVVLQRAQGRQVLTLFPDVNITRKPTIEHGLTETQSENDKSPHMESQVMRTPGKVQSRKHRPIARKEKPLMKPLAIPLGSQTEAPKRLGISEHPKEEK